MPPVCLLENQSAHLGRAAQKLSQSPSSDPFEATAKAGLAATCAGLLGAGGSGLRATGRAAACTGAGGRGLDAIVTGAAPKGTYVRIASPLLEGRVVRGFEGLDVGDNVCVRLVEVNAEKSHIDFEFVPK